MSCWVRLLHFKAALMSGDVWLGPGKSGVLGPWFGPGYRVSTATHCRPVGPIDATASYGAGMSQTSEARGSPTMRLSRTGVCSCDGCAYRPDLRGARNISVRPA